MNSDNLAFKVAAFFMMAGCLVWVLATAVPVQPLARTSIERARKSAATDAPRSAAA